MCTCCWSQTCALKRVYWSGFRFLKSYCTANCQRSTFVAESGPTRDHGAWPECAPCFPVSTHRRQCSSSFFPFCDLLLVDCKCKVCSSNAMCSTEASMSKNCVCPFILKSFWVRVDTRQIVWQHGRQLFTILASYIDAILHSRLTKPFIMVLRTSGISDTLVLDTCRRIESIYLNVKCVCFRPKTGHKHL